LKNGWYAMVPNSGGTFLDSTPQGYTASADVSYFKICNVGTNGLMQTGQADDLCQSFNANSVGDVESFGGCSSLTSSAVKRLYNDGREAIRQASRLHSSCSGSGDECGTSISILNQQVCCGAPMSQVGGFECQDFMSPEDCNLMFNVCDPVICPPSRCDLGGKMPVADVIQTGVIGGLLMCLPNAAEGIKIPICLSGIHAGLDSYVSILKSERACLARSLETGEHVGICDQITSVYKCEFFWRQMSPVVDQLIPSLVAGLVAPGQKVRGGGEYALVSQAWSTAQKSVDYFKSVYAPNAFRAFNLRSSEEIGSKFCKAFIGTSVPASADAIDSLLEPESPPQFYAQFSEELFSGATVPSTSQYSVYFHIYAGNERGVQYRVYLKNPPQTSYYKSNPSVWVDTGYIAKGAAEDQKIDFTAPSGYKELCVVVDAKEECGFKRVSTELGIDLLTKKYTQEQAEKDNIKTEKECMSTSPSALSMANLNPVQSGMEDLAGGDAALSGVVRVCATQNPASTVDARRWEEVGVCGDSNLKCWLDVDSVRDDLEALEAVSGNSISMLDERRGLIENAKMSLEGVRSSLSSLRGKINGFGHDVLAVYSGGDDEIKKVLDGLGLIIGGDEYGGGAGTNADRAEALSLKAAVYRMVSFAKKKAGAVEVEPVANDLPPLGEDVEKETGGEVDQDVEDSFGVGTKVVDSLGEVWEKIDGDIWRGELSLDERVLAEIPSRPVSLLEKSVGGGDAEIVKMEILKNDGFLGTGKNEFFVDVTFENNGEEGRFMLRLYNAEGKKVDQSSHIPAKKGDKSTRTLDTYGSPSSSKDMGESYMVDLWRQTSEAGVYNEVHSVKRFLGGAEEVKGEDVVIYTVEQTSSPTDIYFKYENIWKWSPDEKIWMDVPEVVVSSSSGNWAGRKPVRENQVIILNLKGKNFIDGLEIIKENSAKVTEK